MGLGLIVLLVIVAIVVFMLIALYNGLVQLRVRADFLARVFWQSSTLGGRHERLDVRGMAQVRALRRIEN